MENNPGMWRKCGRKVEFAVNSDYLKDYPVNGKNQVGYVKKGSTDPISL
jgi:hypothetical protein